MKPILLGVASGMVIVAAGFTLIQSSFRSSDVKLEQPPCAACSHVYALSNSIPLVDFPELFANQERYANQLVRVRTVFGHDAGQTFLSTPQGEGEGTRRSMLTGLDQACESCEGARKALTIYSGFEEWYDSEALVVVVGRIGTINNPRSYYHGKSGFNILCLEHVEPLGSGDEQRRKYEKGILRGLIL